MTEPASTFAINSEKETFLPEAPDPELKRLLMVITAKKTINQTKKFFLVELLGFLFFGLAVLIVFKKCFYEYLSLSGKKLLLSTIFLPTFSFKAVLASLEILPPFLVGILFF
ncbi:MAG: hypothetical protein ACJAW3_000172 [Lentimonas sp.]